jgi:acetyl esterase/lipase
VFAAVGGTPSHPQSPVSELMMGNHQGYAKPSPLQTSVWNPLLVGSRRTLTYEDVDGCRETLYLFEPVHVNPGQALPTVVYFHGGSLISGSAVIRKGQKYRKEWIISEIERSLVNDGFAFASVNYRLAPKYKWPSQIDDAKASVQYLQAHASSLHLNPNAITTIGDSAGGALASLVGLTMQEKTKSSEIADSGTSNPTNTSNTSIRAVVDLFGPVDRSYYADKWLAKFGSRPTPAFGVLTPQLIRDASAVSYVRSGDPPFLIVQGKQDPVDPPRLSLELYDKLQAQGDHPQLLLVNHASHELVPVGGNPSPSIPTVVQRIVSFIEQNGQASDSQQVSV